MVTREELLKLQKQLEEQLLWVNEKLLESDTDQRVAEDQVQTPPPNHQYSEKKQPGFSQIDQELNRSLDEPLLEIDKLLANNTSSPVKKSGCLFVAVFLILLFIAAFWLLPLFLYE